MVEEDDVSGYLLVAASEEGERDPGGVSSEGVAVSRLGDEAVVLLRLEPQNSGIVERG